MCLLKKIIKTHLLKRTKWCRNSLFFAVHCTFCTSCNDATVWYWLYRFMLYVLIVQIDPGTVANFFLKTRFLAGKKCEILENFVNDPRVNDQVLKIDRQFLFSYPRAVARFQMMFIAGTASWVWPWAWSQRFSVFSLFFLSLSYFLFPNVKNRF